MGISIISYEIPPDYICIFISRGAVQYAAAQELGGGVDKEGSWYVGEGLKTGDRFEYSVCHVEYKECKPLVMDFWIKGDIVEGTETKWLVETVVYDGNKIIKGQCTLVN